VTPGDGTVYSHTTIRVAGNAHAADAPFVLVLIDADDGSRVLGRWAGEQPPPIGSRVVERAGSDPYRAFAPTHEEETCH
jgi:uncharacterized OB-fold protein